jgi:predicted transcriptional regulator
MENMGDDNGVLVFLARSEIRVAVLRQLAENGTCERSTLGSDLPASDRTVKRTLTEFEGRDWIVQTPSGYALTAMGDHVLTTYESAVESLETAEDIKAFLKRVPGDSCDVPVPALTDAEIVETGGSNPNAPLERALTFRHGAEHLRELSSIVTRESAEQLRQRVREGEIQNAELILEREVIETIQSSPEYREGFDEIVRAKSVSVFISQSSFPFLLALKPAEVALGVTDKQGFPTALVISDSETVYDWAKSVYDRFRADATRFGDRQAVSDSTYPVKGDSE